MLYSPNHTFAPYEVVDGVRRFYLKAEKVNQRLTKDVTIRAWGYNGTAPGPTLVAYEGERVQIILKNELSEDTSVHWHGLVVPVSMDGVPSIGAGPSIKPGETFVYEFVLNHSGTYMYHPHMGDQELMGMGGMFIVLPRNQGPTVSRDYVILLQEWSVKMDHGGSSDMMMEDGGMREKIFDIDPMSMDMNYFTINGKSFPLTEPLWVKSDELIRIRLGNLSMNSHPMHLHGHNFWVEATDGKKLPVPYLKDTINVAPGETYDIIFQAENPGTWAFHCHKPHHITNGHKPVLGGMFTIVKYMD